ncbi:MAG: hypothetical protein H7X94_05890 [Vallitaleaceae bacterium]|nr:hypothetical protein [Vallitaleaceae bacterium]
MRGFTNLWKDERGMGIIEIAIVIVIIIALALIFQEQIQELINTIFDKIDISIEGI